MKRNCISIKAIIRVRPSSVQRGGGVNEQGDSDGGSGRRAMLTKMRDLSRWSRYQGEQRDSGG